MPKPEAEQIIILRGDGDDTDWMRNPDIQTDDLIAAWAVTCIADTEFTEASIDTTEVVIRWSTNSAIDKVVAYRDDSIPPYDDDTSATDPDDEAMVERGERITDTVREALRDILAGRQGD